MKSIRKVVFPVAGFGTRFLPVTKAIPKEMLPIVDKPLIQYAVEEAVAAGATEMIFVTSENKGAIKEHFETNFALEKLLQQKEKRAMLELVQAVLPANVTCHYVRQPEMLGLGHAVLCAKEIVGNEPFGVILPDDIIDNDANPCLKQLVDLYNKHQGSVIAAQYLQPHELEKYGVVDPTESLETQQYAKMKGMVEKPKMKDAPSRFGVVGRYILTPAIFDLLERVTPGAGGEIQLTDAIAALLRQEPVYAYVFDGKRFDCGNKLGFLEATIQYAKKHPEVSEGFLELLRNELNGSDSKNL